jgi:hypothetical protein
VAGEEVLPSDDITDEALEEITNKHIEHHRPGMVAEVNAQYQGFVGKLKNLQSLLTPTKKPAAPASDVDDLLSSASKFKAAHPLPEVTPKPAIAAAAASPKPVVAAAAASPKLAAAAAAEKEKEWRALQAVGAAELEKREKAKAAAERQKLHDEEDARTEAREKAKKEAARGKDKKKPKEFIAKRAKEVKFKEKEEEEEVEEREVVRDFSKEEAHVAKLVAAKLQLTPKENLVKAKAIFESVITKTKRIAGTDLTKMVPNFIASGKKGAPKVQAKTLLDRLGKLVRLYDVEIRRGD